MHRWTRRVTLLRHYAWALVCAGSIALAYFLGARVGLAVQPEGLAAVWPPSGILLAALVLSRQCTWTAILVGVLCTNTVANLNAGQSLAVSLGFSLANCAESVIAAWLLVHYLGTPLTMTRLRDIIGLGGLAVIASNACTALLGAIVVSLSLGSPFWTVWRIWWIADGLGMLMITPTIVTWVTVGRSLFKTCTVGRIVEAVCLYAALAVITQGVFGARPDIAHVPFPSPLVSLPYVLFPFLFWAALRFGLPGATTASVIVAAEALWNTAHGLGPFVVARGTVTDHVLAVQVFLSVAVFSALVAAAVAAEWQCSEQALRDSETRFRTMAETMPIPVVIGRLTDGSILYANAACRTLVDVLPAAPGSRKTTDFFADPAERQQILEALRNQGSIHNYEIRMDITPSGRTMPLARHTPSCSHYILGIPPWA